MTSDRPYREALPPEVAFAEIEAAAGSQFHPLVARAFVAMQRGIDPKTVLAAQECAELKRLWRGLRPSRLERAVTGWPVVTPSGLARRGARESCRQPGQARGQRRGPAALVLVAWRAVLRLRAGRLAARTTQAIEAAAPTDALAAALATVGSVAELSWVGLVSWGETELTSAIEHEWRQGCTGPSEAAVTSWLLRDADAAGRLLAADGRELGCEGRALALPTGTQERIEGYVVLVFRKRPPSHVTRALVDVRDELGAAGRSVLVAASRAEDGRVPLLL